MAKGKQRKQDDGTIFRPDTSRGWPTLPAKPASSGRRRRVTPSGEPIIGRTNTTPTSDRLRGPYGEKKNEVRKEATPKKKAVSDAAKAVTKGKSAPVPKTKFERRPKNETEIKAERMEREARGAGKKREAAAKRSGVGAPKKAPTKRK